MSRHWQQYEIPGTHRGNYTDAEIEELHHFSEQMDVRVKLVKATWKTFRLSIVELFRYWWYNNRSQR